MRQPPRSLAAPYAALCAVFVVSGSTALLFETLWFRLAGLTFGNSVWASSLVLASFMTGLGLGAALAARLGPRSRRPVRLYATLELLIGVTGFALVLVLPSLTAALAPLFRDLLDYPLLLNGLRLLSAFLLLLLPTTAMGATLPLLARGVAAAEPDFGRNLGRLYGWNTLGAVLGSVLGELWLIERLGLRGTGLVAVGLSCMAATLALALARSFDPVAGEVIMKSTEPPFPGGQRRVVRLLRAAAFVAGGLLLALEVVWFRFLLLFVQATSLAFAVMLAVVLAGLSGGGLLASALLRKQPEAHRGLALAALAAGILVVLGYAGFAVTAESRVHSVSSAPIEVGLLALRLVLPTCVLSGLMFTLMGKVVNEELGDPTRAAGILLAANTAGAMCGALVAGFGLLPGLGIEKSFFVLALGYGVVAGLVQLGLGPLRVGRGVRWAMVALAATLALFPFGLMKNHYLRVIQARFGGSAMSIAATREGRTETIVYLRRDLWGERHHHLLVTNGMSMSGSALAAKRYMKQYVYLPVALNPGIRRALLLCYGVGSTARALVDTARLEAIDVVDISRDVLDLAGVVYPDPGTNPLEDPRLIRHVEDARFFLLTTPHRFDLITGEPPPPKNAGVVSLYSQEFFQLVYDRLAERGIASYWLPVNQLELAETRAVVRAFCNVFPDCSLWNGVSTAWLLLGSRGAVTNPVAPDDFGRQWQDATVAAELHRVGFDTPELLGASFLGDADFLRELSGQQEPLVDDRPQRLSPRPPRAQGPIYADIMDAAAARQRFATSAWIGRRWPPDLRERTLPAFDLQAILNTRFTTPVRVARAPYRELERLLQEPIPPPALTLWTLNSDLDELRLARRARESGVSDAYLEFVLGAGAVVERNLSSAEAHWARAQELDPELTFLTAYRAMVSCLANRCDRVASLLSKIRPEDGRETPGLAEWMEKRCPLPPPLTSRR